MKCATTRASMFERVVESCFFQHWDESIFEAPKWDSSHTVGPSLKPHLMVCWSKETCMLARKDMLIFFSFQDFSDLREYALVYLGIGCFTFKSHMLHVWNV